MGVKTGFVSFHQNMLEIELKTTIQGVLSARIQHSTLCVSEAFLHWHRAHHSQRPPDEARSLIAALVCRKVWSLLFLVPLCKIWKVNSVWRVETTSLTYYTVSSSDLGHINILVNSLIIISITAPPQINITSLINADMCDLLQWVIRSDFTKTFQLILLSFWKYFLIKVTYSSRMGSGGCFDTFGNLALSGDCTSRGKKRPDEINAGCWLLQFHGNPHCHPKCLCTDWDICKLSSPINVCLFQCPPPRNSESASHTLTHTSTVGESIISQCCCRAAIMVADEWGRTHTS